MTPNFNTRLQFAVCHSIEWQSRQTEKLSLFANLLHHYRQTGKLRNINQLRSLPSLQFAVGIQFAGERANYPQFAGVESARREAGNQGSKAEKEKSREHLPGGSEER
jgi:hypothetical protein